MLKIFNDEVYDGLSRYIGDDPDFLPLEEWIDGYIDSRFTFFIKLLSLKRPNYKLTLLRLVDMNVQ